MWAVGGFFDGSLRQLEQPITALEVASTFGRLNNGRAGGDDTLQSELRKYCADEISPTISFLLNTMFERHEIVHVWHGLLIPIQKPGKPRGLSMSLRPIVLCVSISFIVGTLIGTIMVASCMTMCGVLICNCELWSTAFASAVCTSALSSLTLHGHVPCLRCGLPFACIASYV